MNRMQYLLMVLAEEASEVSKQALKSARFGITDGVGDTTNLLLLQDELGDLAGVCDMLGLRPNDMARARKPKRVEHYMKVSRERGHLLDERRGS